MRTLGLVGIVALLVCASACASDQTEPLVTSSPEVGADTAIVLPLDRYFAKPQDEVLVDRAFTILVRDCVSQFGLEWVRDLSDDLPQVPTRTNARRYGIRSAEDAAANGYSRPAGAARVSWRRVIATAPPAPHPSPRSDVEAIFSGAIREYNGRPVPEGGCFADSQRRLDEGAPAFNGYGLVEGLHAESSNRAEKDSRVQAVWSLWSGCMANKGFDYTTPWEANDDPQWGSAANKTREIATATADVACREQTNLVGIWHAVDVAYQHQLIEEHQHELDALLELIEVQKRNAARIIAGG